MKFLKFWKPYYSNIQLNLLKKKITITSSKMYLKYNSLTDLQKVFFKFSNKICFFTLKYKTQTNFLKQSRFRLHHELNFNKNHSYFKKI